MEYREPILKRNVSNGKLFYECAECGNGLGQHYHYFCPHCGTQLRKQKLKTALVVIKILED